MAEIKESKRSHPESLKGRNPHYEVLVLKLQTSLIARFFINLKIHEIFNRY